MYINHAITFKLFHTSCTMHVQNHGSNNDICMTDGCFPAQAFCQDYLLDAIQLIANNINITNETNKPKSQLSNYQQSHSQSDVSDQSCCQLCSKRQPPDPSKAVEIRKCDQCGKRFHIQCLNTNLKNQKNKYK